MDVLDTNKYLNKEGLAKVWDLIKQYVRDKSSIVEVTYAELKSLRDNGQLISSQQYRITDYETTTSQDDTTSANHPFDIIVTALDESTLSENASAIRSARDVENYFGTENLEAWQLKYCIDNDTDRFAWLDIGDNSYKTEFVAMFWDDPVNGINYDHHIGKDKIYDWGTESDPETGMDNIVIYKSDTYIYADEGSADYDDKYFYRGIVEVDGKEYDSWKKYEVNGINGDRWVTNGDGQYQYALTERIVFNGQVIWPEIGKTDNRKGVIYNMIDEYGNECPYDFKNIKFYHTGLGTDVYTFTWIDDSYNVIDTSIFGNNGTLTLHGEIFGVYGNVIKPYIEIKQSLNNITFISDYNFVGAGNEGFYGCYSNSFGNNCYNNRFGNNCQSNSLGNGCHDNNFGNDCHINSFGNDCCGNSFGDICYRNSFGNNCYNNRFGNNCQSNSLGNGCHDNSFGEYCNSNSFGNDCSNNSFGEYCFCNSFGNECYNNIFRDRCHYNSLSNNCYSNIFSNDCHNNSFSNSCTNNKFDGGCFYNSFGNNSGSNSFGQNSYYNSLGNGCFANKFGDYCYNNSLGNDCDFNSFRLSASTSSNSNLKSHCSYNHFDDGCSYNVIWNSDTTSIGVLLKNININRGVGGTSSSYNYINVDTINSEKEININNYNGHIYIDYGDIFKVTYSELVTLRNNGQLIPGRQYRITDYNTTTSQENTTSANHPFDIIVTAINEYTLSEDAQAIQNFDDGYFDESNLSAWQLKYCLDNNTDRFAWAGDERIETEGVEGVDSSNCTISVGYSFDDEEGLNKFDNRVSFISQVWSDPVNDAYLEGSAIDELITHWGYETEPNGIENCLTLYGLNLDIDEETGEITSEDGISEDRWYYRGIVTVDNTDYDYWEKAEWGGNTGEFGYMDNDQFSEKLFFLTDRIVSGEPTITTVTVETVIPLEPKGVIYYMKDEFGNELPYDFKNIVYEKDDKSVKVIIEYDYNDRFKDKTAELVYSNDRDVIIYDDTLEKDIKYYAWRVFDTDGIASGICYTQIPHDCITSSTTFYEYIPPTEEEVKAYIESMSLVEGISEGIGGDKPLIGEFVELTNFRIISILENLKQYTFGDEYSDISDLTDYSLNTVESRSVKNNIIKPLISNGKYTLNGNVFTGANNNIVLNNCPKVDKSSLTFETVKDIKNTDDTEFAKVYGADRDKSEAMESYEMGYDDIKNSCLEALGYGYGSGGSGGSGSSFVVDIPTGNFYYDTYLTPMDVVFANANGDKLITNNLNEVPMDCEPIGVVVIPASHDVYGTGECGVISLRESENDYRIDDTQDLGIDLQNMVFVTNNTDNEVYYHGSSYGYLPSDDFNGDQSYVDPKSYYLHNDLDRYMMSPYLGESKNDKYDGSYLGSVTGSFDGKEKTNILRSFNYDVATYCLDYNTIGTQKNDWYLPTVAELGYAMVRKKSINNTLDIIKSYFGIETELLVNKYITSTLSSYDYIISFNSGHVTSQTFERALARPMYRFKL